MRRRIHRGPPGGLAECQTCRSVDKHSEDIREPGLRRGNCLLVDTPLVLKVLEPIWQTKTETATRVRGRIESILDWATVRGYRTGENPARWKGHLDHLLPKRSKVQRVKHHPALPYKDAPAFFQTLRAQSSNSQKALAFLILTATRTNETIGARWKEIDLSAGTWTIPAERMKAGKEHRVPLSKAALELLHEARTEHAASDDYVFVGQKAGRPLSNMAFLQLLKRMNRGDITAHGFRSTFRDWVGKSRITHGKSPKPRSRIRSRTSQRRRTLAVTFS